LQPGAKVNRILIFAAYFLPSVGGYETNIYELSRRLIKRGYQIDIVTCNAENAPSSRKLPTYDKLDEISVYRLPSWNILSGNYPIPKPSFTTFRVLFRLLRNDYGLINTQGRIFLTSLLGLIFARLKRVPLVHTERGTKPAASRGFVELVRMISDYTLGRLMVGLAWKTIGMSRDTCDFLKKMGAREAILIHNGIDTRIFEKKGTKHPNTIVTITFVGRLVYGKGVQDLILAFPEITKESKVKLLIVGDGSYRPELEGLVQRVDKENIQFLGQKNQREIAEILTTTNIFVNPSYSEGLPTSVLEAGAAGLPIVATDVGGTREIIEDGKSGFLIPPGDSQALTEKVCQLIKNKQLREDFGRNIRQFVKENFDWDEIADKWVREVGIS
jgi:glycosyltransferase involved in cell wall biosynthesis